MANDIKLNLTFKVNTNEAKKQMKDLEKSINEVLSLNANDAVFAGFDKDLRKANDNVIKLHGALSRAFNVDTGKLDLSKFNRELKQLNLPLREVRQTLGSLGPEGQRTFQQLAQSILDAEMPTRRLNKTLENFFVTLKKTAGWQLSSNIIHGLQGSLEGAVRYAEDLNKSLNDIRIVTGYNIEHMAEFADKANKAARALSTSTNEYVKASLIYFQQGLADQEVEKRANTTVKLANVTGQTAEEVSSYMTAVWNNFADGTKEIEYYADAITKLGAATASSSEEIATGLQKFSAVAETVGLSYEYATAALATVTSQTRESAETVGTAFKTIFARLESLSLGETLDDDTSMTKYSQALASVGVNIKENNGELRSMDNILDDLGKKWNSISQSQQVALAQTVAGMRQYNNFMALMNNYEAFSSNVSLAKNSEGSLEEQSKIYAESWEAASERVRAAAEEVYSELINDEFMVDALNFIEKLINGVDTLIDSVGGLKGVLAIASAMLLKFAAPQISKGIQNTAYNIKGFLGFNKKEAAATKDNAFKELEAMFVDMEKKSAGGYENAQQAAILNNLKTQLKLSKDIFENEENLSDEAKQRLGVYQEMLKKIGEIRAEAAGGLENAANEKGSKITAFKDVAGGEVFKEIAESFGQEDADTKQRRAKYEADKKAQEEELKNFEAKKQQAEDFKREYEALVNQYESQLGTEENLTDDKREQATSNFKEGLRNLNQKYGDSDGVLSNAQRRATGERKDFNSLRRYGKRLGWKGKEAPELQEPEPIKVTKISSKAVIAEAKAQADALQLTEEEREKAIQTIEEYIKAVEAENEASSEVTKSEEAYNKVLKETNKLLTEETKKGKDWGVLLSEVGSAAAALTGSFAAMKGAVDIWQDDSLSGWEKFGGILTSLITAVPMFTSAFKTLKGVVTDQTVKTWLLNAAQAVNNKLTGENTQLQKENTEARDKNGQEITEDIKEEALKNPGKLKGFGSKIKGGGKEFISGAKNTIELKKAAKLAGTAGKAATVAPGAAGAAAGGSTAAALGSIAVAAAPYVLAAAAIAAVAVIAYKHYNKAEDLAKEAEARAKALQGMVDSAKESYQELSQAVTSFEDANNALKDLTKGTQEWRDALEASNEQARVLIEQFKTSLRAGDYFFSSDGQIQFKEGVLEELQTKQADAIAKTQATADFAKIEANQKREEANTLKLARRFIVAKYESTNGNVVNMTDKEKTSEIDKLKEAYSKDSTLLDKMWQAIENNQVEDFAKTYDVSVNLVAALNANRKATEDLFKETVAATNQSALLRQTIIENANKDNAEYADSKYKEIINAIAANDLENVKESDDYKQAFEEFEKFSLSDEYDQQKILKALYGENASKYRFEDTFGDLTLKTQDKDGNWVLVEGTKKNDYKKSTLKDQYAKAVAAGITSEEMTSLKDRTNKLVSDLTSMGFESSQINAIGASLANGTAVDLTKISRGALSNITDDSINNLDEKYQELMRKARDSTDQMWAKASTIYRTYAGEDAKFSENQTLDSLRAVTSAASQIAIKGGSEAAIAFTNYADSIIDSYPSKADEINSILQNIDWDQSGPEAMADLRMQLEEIGISVNSTNTEWATMLDKVNEIKASVDSFSLDKLRQEIVQTTKILDGLKNGNNVISDEDYKKLSEYSAEVADMFTLTADGYKFIGGATEAENRSKIEELEKITTKVAADKSKDQLNKIDLAERAKATMQLDKDRAGDQFQDMIWVADSEKYKDFLAATGLNADKLREKGEQGQAARGRITELQKELETLEVGSAEYEDIQNQISEQEDLLADAQFFADTMYEKANWVKNLDPDQARKDNADLQFSQIDSLKQLMELEDEYANDPNYAKAFEDRKTQLENEIALRRESIDTTQNEQAALKALGKEQENLAEKKKLSSGQDYLDALEEEVGLIDEEVSLYNQLVKDKAEDRREAQSNLSDLLGSDVTIKKDANGNITNWEELDNAAMAMSPENVELYKEYKEKYNQAAEGVEEYRDKIKEAKEDQKALWLEGATYAREYNDSIRDLEYDWLENQLSNLEDAEYSAAEKMALLGQQAKLVQEESVDLTKELDKIAAAAKVDRLDGESTADFMERIVKQAPEAKEKIDELAASYLANANSLKEIDKELANTLVQHFDQIATQYDKVGERIQRLSETTEHYKNIINLVGKKNIVGSEATLKALGEMQQRTANATLENSRAKYEKLKADQQKAQEQMQAALAEGDTNTIDYWNKQLEEIDKKVYDAQTEMNNDWAAALQTAADVFAENTATILENFETSLSGVFGSFDRMQEVFGQQSELNSQYVADYKRVYELSKLTRDIQNQIDNTDSIAAKSELKDLQAEINELQESGTEMSQYDLDYLQKRYDLRLAELALEEARNAKSQVRLQKMENGGWGYVYTQNDDAVSNAQQNYEDKLYALQELSNNYLNETSEKIISTQANFEAAIQQIMSSGLSDEEKKKQVQETVEFYREKLNFLTSEFDSVIANNQGMANMVQSFSESLLGAMYPEGEFDSADNIFANFNDQVGDWESGTGLLGELKAAMETFKEGTVAIFTAAGQEGIDGFMAGANAHTNTDMTSDEYKVGESAVPDVEPVLISIVETREALAAEYQKMVTDYKQWLQDMTNTKLVNGEVNNYSGESSKNSYTYAGVGNTPDRYKLLKSWGILTPEDDRYIEMNWNERESDAFRAKMRELWQRAINQGFAASFDTGGYTGSWGSGGRMAMLHEKEIVLNKDDTTNLLKMVSLVDNIIKTIDASSFATLYNRSINIPSVSSTGDTLQQEVTIHAEFPNATNHSEIEEAFNSLINRAAQYTNRNR